ncbi:MAG: carbohydrate ABC transporter permease [Oscillospiraceae bacterium]|nr:carbohydrate ABC transporter permease [Oscillospiraceae bacterium]
MENRFARWWNKNNLAVRHKSGNILKDLLIYMIFIAIAFMILFPLFQKVTVILKSQADLVDNTVKYVAKEPTLDTLKRAIEALDYWSALAHSLLLSLGVALLQMMTSSFIAYGIARFRFVGRSLVFALIILTLVIPPQVLLSSMYLNFRFFDFLGIFKVFLGKPLNLINSAWPFVLLAFTGLGIKNGLYIYMLRQFYRGLPVEFEEAAYIDGAGIMRSYFTIMLPNARTIMVSVFLFAFSWQFTDSSITPMLFNDFATIPNALMSLETYQVNQLEPAFRSALITAGSLLAIIPLVLLFVVGQRFFVMGIERSGIVG